MTTIFVTYSPKDNITVSQIKKLFPQITFVETMKSEESNLKISKSSLFIWLISDNSLGLKICQEQYRIATELKKPFLPVLIAPSTRAKNFISQKPKLKNMIDITAGLQSPGRATLLFNAIMQHLPQKQSNNQQKLTEQTTEQPEIVDKTDKPNTLPYYVNLFMVFLIMLSIFIMPWVNILGLTGFNIIQINLNNNPKLTIDNITPIFWILIMVGFAGLVTLASIDKVRNNSTPRLVNRLIIFVIGIVGVIFCINLYNPIYPNPISSYQREYADTIFSSAFAPDIGFWVSFLGCIGLVASIFIPHYLPNEDSSK